MATTLETWSPKKSLSHKFAVMGETYCPQQNTPPLDRGVGVVTNYDRAACQ